MSSINHIKIILITIFVIFISTHSKSEITIAIVEMDKIMTQSLAGKSLVKQLSKIDSTNKKYFDDYKKNLSSKKQKISAQKNILAVEEYNKKIIDINKDFEKFQKEAKKRITLVQSKRDVGMKKIFDELKILLSEYSNKNKLTFIIDQKNIIIGKTELNVTNQILKLLNQKVTQVDIK